MHCPVLSGYLAHLKRKVEVCPGLYEPSTKEYLKGLCEQAELAANTTGTVCRLRAFYLAHVLCMVHIQEAVQRVYSRLSMDQQGEQGMVLLTKVGERSWSGLSAVMEHISSLILEVKIEHADLVIQGRATAGNTMLIKQLETSRRILEESLEAVSILRGDLTGEEPKHLHCFIAAYIKAERCIPPSMDESLKYVEDMFRITPTITLVPKGNSTTCQQKWK